MRTGGLKPQASGLKLVACSLQLSFKARKSTIFLINRIFRKIYPVKKKKF